MMRTVLGRLVVVGLLAGCGGGSPHSGDLVDGGDVIDSSFAFPDAPADAEPFGPATHFVQNTLDVPTTPTEAQMFGIDLDGDPQGRPDNLIGSLLATLEAQDVSAQAATDEAVADGTIVHLHTLSTSGSNAVWQVYLGEATPPPPDFSGTGSFAVAADSPLDARLEGILAGTNLVVGPGEVSVDIVMSGGVPIRMNLVGARIEGNVTATGCIGKLGGAMRQEAVDVEFLPALAESMNATVLADPGCPTMCGASAQTLLDLFDHNLDGMILVDELRTDDLIASILAPDLDLFDASGAFHPRFDNVKESLSIGMGFSCVPASFTTP